MNKADELKYKALQKAIANDKIRIFIDSNKICKPNSPIYNPWESLLPVLIPILIGLILIVAVGPIFGLIFICLMICLCNTFFKKYLFLRIINRTKDFLSKSYQDCENLWNYGGVILINVDDKKTGCVAPEGDWKDFVTLHFADLMLEKKE